jgi:hypothetical protein
MHALQGVCKGIASTLILVSKMLQAVLEGSPLLSDVRQYFYSTRTKLKHWCRVTLRTMQDRYHMKAEAAAVHDCKTYLA